MAVVTLHLTDKSWSEEEYSQAAAHNLATKELLAEVQSFIAKLTTPLDEERRTLVELAAWMELAAVMAKERLKISVEDFITASLEVYTATD